MSNENYFIKLYLIGDKGVGKKSLQSKLSALKSSSTQISQEQKLSSLKVFKLKNANILLQSMVADEAEELKYNDDIDSEDEDFEIEKEYKMSFIQTHQSIKTFFNYQVDQRFTVENVLVYMFDMTDYSSFEKMVLYYKSINMKLKLDKLTVFILGNKAEKQIIFTKEQKDKINMFIKSSPLFHYYEISTKLYFNFPKFAENLIKISLNNKEDIDYDELSEILNYNQNFNKAERGDLISSNDNPGVGQYDIGVYSFKSKKEMIEAFSPKNRFIKKIFTNKSGPVMLEDKHIEKKPDLYSGIKFAEIGELLIGNSKKGYTMACREGVYHLREKRLEKRQKINEDLRSSFEENLSSLDLPRSASPKSAKDDSYYNDVLKRKKELLRENSNERKKKREHIIERQKENYKLQTENYYTKLKTLTEANEPYTESKIEEAKKRYLEVLYGKNILHVNKIDDFKDKSTNRKKIKVPGPQSYDTRGNLLNIKKGASIVSRKIPKTKEVYNAQYHAFKSTFDKISESPDKGILCYAQRYSTNIVNPKAIEKENKIAELAKEIDEKHERYQKNKGTNLRYQYISSFIEREKSKMEEHSELMRHIKEEEENYYNNLWKSYDNVINYSQVESSSPKYSIKGKYIDKRSEIESYIKSKNDNTTINEKEPQLEYPSVDFAKPVLPKYSFGKEKRFIINEDKIKEGNADNSEILFKDYKYAPEDVVQFSCKQSYDFNDKRSDFTKANGYPGVGAYTFKSFADETVEKATKFKPPVLNIKKKEEKKKEPQLELNLESKRSLTSDDNDNNNEA